ncbi:MAG: FecR domain-containing protein [Pseudoxanthomonas sp.]
MTAEPAYARRLVKKSQYWVERLTSGEITARELRQLDAWLARDPRHRAAFERERAFWHLLGQQQEAFHDPTPDPVPPGLVGRAWEHRGAAFGLVMALALVLPFLPRVWLQVRADHITGTTVRTLTLDDGSRVVLDAESAIAYDHESRTVELLRGRAWFEVVHKAGPALRVTALGGVSRDVGTAFEVAREGNQVRTTVTQGTVDVAADPDSNRFRRLGAGQSVDYREGGVLSPVREVDPALAAAWRNGDILLHDADPRAAVAEVARYRRGPVWVLGDLSDRKRISALFRVDQPDEALRLIARQSNLQLRELPGGIVILRPAGAVGG